MRPVTASSPMREHLFVLAGLLAVFVASALLPHTPLMESTVCVIRLASGYSCPGCGLGRSFVSMTAGDPAGAFAAHPLGPVLYAAALFWLARTAWILLASRPDVRSDRTP